MTGQDRGPTGGEPPSSRWRRFFAETARAENPHHVRVGYSSAANARAVKDLVRGIIGPGGGRLILDAGCGDGLLTGPLAGGGAAGRDQVVGVDFTAGMLTLARAEGLLPVGGDIGRLPFADGVFDLVACVETVTCTDDPDAVLAELARVVRPGGRLIVTGLNRRAPIRALAKQAMLMLGHPQPTLLDPARVAEVLERVGMRLDGIVWVALRLARRTGGVGGLVATALSLLAPNFAIVARKPA